ncbi:MAG: DUF2264 domain-containing protein [Lachnospiraceae bacterium]|nr:DUF2264 domain-containing protein [Lachnospiraceae bacterium]
MAFRTTHPDYTLSPYTGLTREGWIEAGKYMLEGIFQHIADFEDPVVMPRRETEITYPHLKDSEEDQHTQRLAEMFEGLTRSFFIAAPLIHIEPELTICGYKLKEYYKNQVLKSVTRGDACFVGYYEDQQEITGHKNPFRTFQQTVETCALVICLWLCKEEIWDSFTKEEKDRIAAFLTSYAHANTVPQNWRLFNMLDMAFLHMEGYPIDRGIMRDHAQVILNYYAGDGWYRDGHCFDYYSCWAFNLYTPIWNLWYGYENEPYLAAKFEENSNKLMETYADFFDEDGFTMMWGRSNIYRNAATSSFVGNLLLKHPSADPGLARRISSGSLLQFLSRDDFLWNGIPTLGFYGQFGPLVQGYSCAESPFWLGKAYLCLHLPADHPFWTAVEHNGTWEKPGEKEVKETTLDGPALCFTNHKANGSNLLRTAKVVKRPDDIHGMWNYSRLCFHSKYPWEATPTGEGVPAAESMTDIESVPAAKNAGAGDKKTARATACAQPGEVESMQYMMKDGTTGELTRANVTFWGGEKGGVLYRRQFFKYNLGTECHWMQAVNLADFPVPYGLIRADKFRFCRRPVSITLGSFGFPDNGTEITRRQEGDARAIILKGRDFTGKEKQLVMTIYDGWDTIDVMASRGTNPDSERSLVIYAKTAREKQYGYEPYILISQVITKESHEDFAWEELFPIQKVEYTDPQGRGGYGVTRMILKDGTVKELDFEGMEGHMAL